MNPEPVSYSEGRIDTFWLLDVRDLGIYAQEFELRLVSPRAYWYVERGVGVSQADLEDAAAAFEKQIYPRISSAMGREWIPGVDNDVHLSIINGRLRGPAGYYSSADEHPVSVHPYSNQREALYMSVELRIGTPAYLATLSHELHHIIHWAADPGEETWVNEGLSEVATTIGGYRPFTPRAFLSSPTTSLTNWPLDPLSSLANYGGASLFFEYLSGHFGTLADLKTLISRPEDGIAGIDAYLAALGSDERFPDVFQDWVVANLLDEPGDGPYSYPNRDVTVSMSGSVGGTDRREASIPQYAAEYVEIKSPEEGVTVRFQGDARTPLLPVEIGADGCWWSNRGDSISSSLTREVDLSGVSTARVRYRAWFEIEEGWDYAYLEVSRDGGLTWDIIAAPGTSSFNPVGNSFGPGYTGDSDGWIEEEADLSSYVGQRVLIRFHYVTDDATSGIGLCLDDITIPEVAFSDKTQGYEGWQAEGFVRTDNRVPQEFIVQVVELGQPNRVIEMELDSSNRGQITLDKSDTREGIVVVVAALAPQTRQEASYTLTREPTS